MAQHEQTTSDNDWWQRFSEEGSVEYTKTDVMTRSERYRHYSRATFITPLEIIWSDWRARVGLLTILLFLGAGIFGRYVLATPTTTGPRLVKPFQTLAHPIGTDALGRDILGLVVFGIKPMLLMILGGAVSATVLASAFGIFAGYKGGRIDTYLTNFMDMVIAIPGFPLVIVIAAIFAPRNPIIVGMVLSVNAWAGLGRMVRAEVLSIRQHDYVEASQTMGLSTSRIILKDVLPNLAPYISMHFVGMARTVIFFSVGLYFLGVLPYEAYNWGLILNNAYQMGALYTWDVAHWLLAPMVAIVLLTTGLTLLAQSLDSIFNPRIRARHMEKTKSDSETPSEGGH